MDRRSLVTLTSLIVFAQHSSKVSVHGFSSQSIDCSSCVNNVPAHLLFDGSRTTSSGFLNDRRKKSLRKNNVSDEETSDFIPTNTEVVDEPLSPQDEIIKQALGIEPEKITEKQQRVRTLSERAQKKVHRNTMVAVVAFLAAVFNYAYRLSNPVTDVQLLYQMSSTSAPVTCIGTNGRPTVVDFWAPWCENCKRSASTLAAIEKEYGGENPNAKVNFIMINGDDDAAWPLIERFRVDAIPHLALIDREGNVETALIGPVPAGVLRADLDVLVEEGEKTDDPKGARSNLPYTMFDAFAGHDELRKITF